MFIQNVQWYVSLWTKFSCFFDITKRDGSSIYNQEQDELLVPKLFYITYAYNFQKQYIIGASLSQDALCGFQNQISCSYFVNAKLIQFEKKRCKFDTINTEL